MVLLGIVDVVLVAQLIEALQMFLVLFKQVVAMQPVGKGFVQGHDIDLPLLRRHRYWNRMAFDNNEVRVGKSSLQKAGHEEISRSLLNTDDLARIPMRVPALPEPGNVLRRQQTARLGAV